jgi:hypothetical protein
VQSRKAYGERRNLPSAKLPVLSIARQHKQRREGRARQREAGPRRTRVLVRRGRPPQRGVSANVGEASRDAEEDPAGAVPLRRPAWRTTDLLLCPEQSSSRGGRNGGAGFGAGGALARHGAGLVEILRS